MYLWAYLSIICCPFTFHFSGKWFQMPSTSTIVCEWFFSFFFKFKTFDSWKVENIMWSLLLLLFFIFFVAGCLLPLRTEAQNQRGAHTQRSFHMTILSVSVMNLFVSEMALALFRLPLLPLLVRFFPSFFRVCARAVAAAVLRTHRSVLIGLCLCLVYNWLTYFSDPCGRFFLWNERNKKEYLLKQKIDVCCCLSARQHDFVHR